MSDILDCCGCCILCCACLSICDRVCIYIPWGKKHKFSGDPEDEAYAADVERQMQVERDRQPESYTQLQPQGSDKVAVKNHIMGYNGQEQGT